MSELHTLIRVNKFKLDEKRRALAELQALADRLAQEAQRLEAEIIAEKQIARSNTEFAVSYPAYARMAITRGKRLQDSVLQVKKQIEAATEEIAEAFQELKRYELAQEARDRREQERLRRIENTMFDEVALSGFTRRRDQG
ncbi:MAG: flagellar FliJ family protein [Azospirillaceae bacterium]|nr:flagellar FliJ family protein [Azospirillaceae bacterium]